MLKSIRKRTQTGLKKKDARGGPLPLAHVAIIMDGNRRWADRLGIPRLLGHREGVQSLKRLVRHAAKVGLQYLTVYAFSSENWQRGKEEVDYLMELFAQVLTDELDELRQAGVRLRFIGDISTMPDELQRSLQAAEERTADNTGLKLQVALNYGSRMEITEVVRRIAAEVRAGRLEPHAIDEELVGSHLFTSGMPDPDLLIRTGGEMRLSNYLLWQSAYAELYMTPVLWPDFDESHFDRALSEFRTRQRRYGGD